MPAITQELVRLTGELTAYRAVGSDGWGVGSLRTATAERVAVTGKLLGVRAGDTVELEGTWVDSEAYGRQLKVRRCIGVRPETDAGVVGWLSTTLPDIGTGRAHKLVKRFGATLWEVIEHRPSELAQVDGITPARAAAIHEAYLAHKANRDNMVCLRGWGLTDNQVARCVTEWHTLAAVVQRIRENPYQLSQHVYGFGFVRADVVATRAGVLFDAPARVAAGVEHVLGESTSDGHCYLPWGALCNMTVKLLGVDATLVEHAIRAAVRGGRAVCRGTLVYSLRMDKAEAQCTHALRSLLRRAA